MHGLQSNHHSGVGLPAAQACQQPRRMNRFVGPARWPPAACPARPWEHMLGRGARPARSPLPAAPHPSVYPPQRQQERQLRASMVGRSTFGRLALAAVLLAAGETPASGPGPGRGGGRAAPIQRPNAASSAIALLAPACRPSSQPCTMSAPLEPAAGALPGRAGQRRRRCCHPPPPALSSRPGGVIRASFLPPAPSRVQPGRRRGRRRRCRC